MLQRKLVCPRISDIRSREIQRDVTMEKENGYAKLVADRISKSIRHWKC